MQLPALNLPQQYPLNTQYVNDALCVFDSLRHKWVALTPEEWVRQNLVHYICQTMQVPSGRMANEATISVNGLTRRCDTLIYNSFAQPLIIVEYKRPSVKLTQKVFDQIAGYNSKLGVPYLIVSNGLMHIFCKPDYNEKRYIFYEHWPLYPQIDIEL